MIGGLNTSLRGVRGTITGTLTLAFVCFLVVTPGCGPSNPAAPSATNGFGLGSAGFAAEMRAVDASRLSNANPASSYLLAALPDVHVIDFNTFPGGAPIPTETVITDQFKSLGVVFQSLYPNSPRALTGLGGILISGGPTGFFGDIGMDFSGCLPSAVTLEIIGSGLNIRAHLEARNTQGVLIGTLVHTYSGLTGQLSPFTFTAPQGETIKTLLYNGGGNPAAASIGTLIFRCSIGGNAPFTVTVDVKNTINPNSNAVIQVAILSSNTFDATTVDPLSVNFGPNGARITDNPKSTTRDVDHDGSVDLLLYFRSRDLDISCGTNALALTGKTHAGQSFQGSDSVQTVGCK